MVTTQWVITLVMTLVGGGAMGAIINNWFTNRRNKRQPIHYGVQTIKVLRKHKGFPSLQAILMIGDDSGPGRAVSNLSVSRVTLGNKGNKDFERFNFGITFEGSEKAIDVKLENPDRHHKFELLTPVDLLNPQQEMDFRLQPFNRGDVYVVSVLFTYEDASRGLVVSSPHPERLIEVSPWSISPSVADKLMSWTMRIFIITFVLFMLYALYEILTSKGDALPIPSFF